MSRFRCVLALSLYSCLISVSCGETYTPGRTVNKDFGSYAKSFLASHCVDCHGQTKPEGNLSLHDLGPSG